MWSRVFWKSSTKKSRFFTGIEIALVAAIVLGLGSAYKGFKDAKELKKTAKENTEQAGQIDELVGEIQYLNKEKDQITEDLNRAQDGLKEEAATGFSILYEQAKDIAIENPSEYTKVHEKTAKDYVKVWGYDAMAQIIKWQADQLEKQLQEAKAKTKEVDALRQNLLEVKLETQQKISEAKSETEQHKSLAQKLEGQVETIMGKKDLFSEILFWGALIGGGYLFLTMVGIPLLLRRKRKMAEQLRSEILKEKKKKNRSLKAIKAFRGVNEEGNTTMDSICKNIGVDPDKDDDDDD